MRMNMYCLCVSAIAFLGAFTGCQNRHLPEEKEPSVEQVEAAKVAFAKFGAQYSFYANSRSGHKVHMFVMPENAIDADLKGLSDLPFHFELGLRDTKVTDAGLKELKRLKHITGLDLWNTEVTDAGIDEIKELNNLTYLQLHGTKVTDAGFKQCHEYFPRCNIFR